MVNLTSIIALDPDNWVHCSQFERCMFHVAIHLSHRRLLRLLVNNTHYQFMVLPFGLAAAP